MEETDKMHSEDEYAFPSKEEVSEALKKLPEDEATAIRSRMKELLKVSDRIEKQDVRLDEEIAYLKQEVHDLGDAEERVRDKSRLVRNLEAHGTSAQLESEKQALELLQKYYNSKLEDTKARIAKAEETVAALKIESRRFMREYGEVLHQLGLAQPWGDEA